MNITDRRLRKLENQFGCVDEKKRILLVACRAGWGLALDEETCIFLTDPNPRELAVRELFTKAGFTIVEQRDFRSWLFVHFALDCAMENEGLKAGSMARAFDSGCHRRDAILNMREPVPLLAALSVDLKDQSSYLAPFRLPTWLLGPIMGLAPKLLGSVRVLLDSHSNMEELRSTCHDVLAEARRLGVKLPRLEAASRFSEARVRSTRGDTMVALGSGSRCHKTHASLVLGAEGEGRNR